MSATYQEFLARVDAAIGRYHMLAPGDIVVVGVSGGPDSVALLHCLVALKKRRRLDLVVAHLNHQLRGATASQEAVFVESLALRLNVPCESSSRDVASYADSHRLSIQEAARKVRYAFYREVSRKYGAAKIALGHQADDNAESVLIHLLRGTGPRGLAGIPPVRDGCIIRPLIEMHRAQILQFLETGGFEYVEDHSNLDPKYLRNRIRHRLLPSLKADYNPRAVWALTRLAEITREEEDFWGRQVTGAFQGLVLEQATGRLVLSASGLAHLHPALLRRMVRHAVLSLRGNLRRLGHQHVEAVVHLVKRSSPSGRIDLPGGVMAVRDRHELVFLLGPPEKRPRYQYQISSAGSIFVKEISAYLHLSLCEAKDVGEPGTYPPTTALMDLAAVSFPFIVRSPKEGDRFRPLGMSGSQKVKTFFINLKVPRSKRRRCPLLLSGSRIIWVAGYRIDDSAKVTEETKLVLKAELLAA
ncbi:MAG: tRNA lysidine(34) synthetase TilS [Thermodesulfobacteriota bacterium]|nr:tRNA lysidine(34) synthetase TilS [Thermodesulfobacteriota bacterium]